jgi:hypothetical protein
MAKLAMVAAAVLSLGAVQEEMIENPEYKSWSGVKVGSWVKAKTVSDTGQMKINGTDTLTLKEVTADKVVLDNVMIMEMMGKSNETKLSRTVPVKIKKGLDSEGQKIEKTGEGDEEVEINGKKYKCHWIEMKFDGEKGSGTTKSWTTDQIIGGMAKAVIKIEKPMHMTVTRTVVEWKAAE